MNYKLLFPTYRTRERWIHDAVPRGGRMLNVGAGEGDIDPMLASFASELESCDINEADVAQASRANAWVPNLRYSVQDSEALAFEAASFDVVLALEVIEHVAHPQAMLSELARVLKPGGTLVLTCPSVRFPPTYDPINAALAPLGKHVPLGAYGYGHSWLVDAPQVESWIADVGCAIVRRDRLSGWLVGAMECYWPGLLQRALKANAGNTRGGDKRRRGVRPSSSKAPPLVGVVDALIAADRMLSWSSDRSVGLAYVARRLPA